MAKNGYKYRWAEWFSQPRTTLLRGVNYHCSQSSMVGAIRNKASQLGVHVRLTDSENSITVEVVSALSHPNTPTVAGQPEPPALAPTSQHI